MGHDDLSLSEILNHLGEDTDAYFGAVVPPIIQSSNFCFKSVEALRDAIADEFNKPIYTRGTNPTVKILRQKVAALEGAEDALVCASGSAAIALAVLSQLKAGDHVVCIEKPYSWTRKLFSNLLARFGVETTFVQAHPVANFAEALRPNTKVIFLESPNSWTFEIQDLRAIANLAKAKSIVTIIDNSCSTPLNQRPLEFGIDLVVHSSTKYLSGHGDVVSGVVCGSREKIRDIFYGPFMTLGGIISPHDAWLLIRGLRTLEIRVKRSAETTPRVVEFLENHPKIAQVYYTHSKNFSQYDLARAQIKQGGGLFSITLKSEERADVDRFCDRLQRFQLAASWGGYESLVLPVSAMIPQKGSGVIGLPLNMVRFYIGLEDAEFLIADLRQALAAV